MGQRAEQAASPTSNALGWCVLARSSAVTHEGPMESPRPICPGPGPQARTATHRPGGGGRNPTLCPQDPVLLTSDLQVGEGLHRNGDAERQQRERGVTRLPEDIPRPGYHDSFEAFFLARKGRPHLLASPAANTLLGATKAGKGPGYCKRNISFQKRVDAWRMAEGREEWQREFPGGRRHGSGEKKSDFCWEGGE